jgi:hypothetical protein
MTSICWSEYRESLLNCGFSKRTKILIFLNCFIHHFLQVNFSTNWEWTERIKVHLLIDISNILSGLLFLTHLIYFISTTVESLVKSLSFFRELSSQYRLITFSHKLHLYLAEQRLSFLRYHTLIQSFSWWRDLR